MDQQSLNEELQQFKGKQASVVEDALKKDVRWSGYQVQRMRHGVGGTCVFKNSRIRIWEDEGGNVDRIGIG